MFLKMRDSFVFVGDNNNFSHNFVTRKILAWCLKNAWFHFVGDEQNNSQNFATIGYCKLFQFCELTGILVRDAAEKENVFSFKMDLIQHKKPKFCEQKKKNKRKFDNFLRFNIIFKNLILFVMQLRRECVFIEIKKHNFLRSNFRASNFRAIDFLNLFLIDLLNLTI